MAFGLRSDVSTQIVWVWYRKCQVRRSFFKRSVEAVERTDRSIHDPDLLGEISQRIVDAVEPQRIVVFGSAARGELGPESDLDLLVVWETDGSTLDAARQVRKLFEGWGIPMDIMVVTPEDFEQGRCQPGHVARVAERTGMVLYER